MKMNRGWTPVLIAFHLLLGPLLSPAFGNQGTFGFEFELTNEKILQATTDPSDVQNETSYNNLFALEGHLRRTVAQNGRQEGFQARIEEVYDKNNQYAVQADFKFQNHEAPMTITYTCDPGTIEVIGTPMTVAEYSKKKDFMQKYIFQLGNSLPGDDRLQVDSKHGAGHIHVGIESHFQGNRLHFRNFLTDLMNHSHMFMGALNLDPTNAPTIGLYSDKIRRRFAGILQKFDSNPQMTIEDLVREIEEKIYYQSFDKTRFPPEKYQAINLRHILSVEDPNHRTVEIRGLRAQRNMDDYLKLITLFQKRIDYIKTLTSPLPFKDEGLTLSPLKVRMGLIPNPQKAWNEFAEFVQGAGLDVEEYKDLLPASLRNYPLPATRPAEHEDTRTTETGMEQKHCPERIIEGDPEAAVSPSVTSLATAVSHGVHKAFFAALKANNIKEVIRLLDQGVDINTKNERGENALMVSLQLGQEEMALELLRRGIDWKSRTAYGWNGLHMAIGLAREKVASVILAGIQGGDELNERDGYQRSYLHLAASTGQKQVMQALMDKGLPPDLQDSEGQTPLFEAIELGHDQAAQILLQAGAKVDIKNDMDRTPLHVMAKKGKLQLLQMAKPQESMINAIDETLHTPLKLAMNHGHVEVVEYLVQNGAAVNMKSDRWRRTPLQEAIMDQQPAILRALLTARPAPDLDRKGGPGSTALHMAVLNDRGGEDDEEEDQDGLQSAVEMTEILLQAGANVNALDMDGKTPLKLAVENLLDKHVELLVNHPAIDLSTRKDGQLIPLEKNEYYQLIVEISAGINPQGTQNDKAKRDSARNIMRLLKKKIQEAQGL